MWGAAFAAALFAVHPVQVMTSAWIAEQKNLFSCLFVLLAMLAWLNFVRSKLAVGAGRGRLLRGSCAEQIRRDRPAIALLTIDLCVVRRGFAASLWRILAIDRRCNRIDAPHHCVEQKFIDSGDMQTIPHFFRGLLLAAGPSLVVSQAVDFSRSSGARCIHCGASAPRLAVVARAHLHGRRWRRFRHMRSGLQES